MNCEEVRELLAAYALGALEPDEVEDVEAHLREGHEHDQELTELRATVFALDLYADELRPAGALPPPLQLRTVPASQRPRERASGLAALTRAWGALAAAIVLLAFGAGWLASQVINDPSDTYAYVVQGGDGALMEVTGKRGEESVLVTMAGFTRLDGQSYQVWAIRDGQWLSVGVCNTNAEGRWRGDFEFELQPRDDLALTVEPAGGSERPTGEPVLHLAH